MQVESGRGRLHVARRASRTVVLSSLAASPLRLIATRGDAAAHVFSTTFGGGLVDGDRVSLDVRVEEGARLLLTTQASTKVYRGRSESILTATVARDGLLAIVPDAVVCFDAAEYRQRTEIELALDGSLAFVDLLHAGRVARGERWAMRRYRNDVIVRGDTALRDALLLDPAHGDVAARLGRFDVLGTVILAGPLFAAARARITAEHDAPVRRDDACVVACSTRGDALLVRLAAIDAETAFRTVRALLSELPPLVGDLWARKR